MTPIEIRHNPSLKTEYPLGLTMGEFRKFTKDLHDSVEVTIQLQPNFFSSTASVEIVIMRHPNGYSCPLLSITPTTPPPPAE